MKRVKAVKTPKKVPKPRAVKYGPVQKFKSDFSDNCLAGDCRGWKTLGTYSVDSSADGKSYIQISATIKSPIPLSTQVSRAALFFSAQPFYQ